MVEIRYFDASHQLVDTAVESLYGFVVPGNGAVAFRSFEPAARPKQAYAAAEARVVSAEPHYSRARAEPTTMSMLGEFLYSWGPMILLLAVWAFFVRRSRRKDSPQERSIALMQQHFEQARAQTQERIAAALEVLAAQRGDRRE